MTDVDPTRSGLGASNCEAAHLQEIVANLREPVLLLDGELMVIAASPPFRRLSGAPLRDVVGRRLDELGDATHAIPELQRLLANVLQARGSLTGLELRHDFGGGERLLLLNAARVPTGQEPLVMLAIEDVTERKAAENLLRDREQRLQLACDAGAIGTFVWYPDEDRSDADDRMLALFGLEKGQSLNLAWVLAHAIEPTGRERYAAAVARACDPAGGGLLDEEIRLSDAAGEGRWLAIRGQAQFEGEPPRAVRLIGTVRDITRRKRQESDLALLAEITGALAKADGIEQALTVAVKRIGFHFAASACAFGEVDEHHDSVSERASWVRSGAPARIASYRFSDCHDESIRQALVAGEIVTVSDVATDPRVTRQCWDEVEAAAFVNVPLVRGDELRFILSVCDRAPRAWRNDDIVVLRKLAERIGDAVESHRIQQALRDSGERFRALVTTTAEATFRLSADWSELRSLKGGGFLASTTKPDPGWFERYIPQQERARFSAAIEEAFNVRGFFELEHRVIRSDGSIGWAASRATPIFDARGQIREWFGAATDITQRKRAERETVRLASIVATSDDAIISKDLQGVVTTWNPAAERMFGWSAREAIGQPIMSLIIPADRMEEERDILVRLARGEVIDHFETVRRRKDGSLVDVSVTISPLRQGGRIVGASKIARDIGERKHNEMHREQLIHELNHRVKNTLATVQALAMQTFRAPSERATLATFDARLRALSAAHDVLTRENWKGAGMHEIVRNAVAAWSGARVNIHGPDFRLRPAAALAIAMVLHELATNASKYGALSDEHGTVDVGWSVDGGGEPCFRMHWREQDGPPVSPPTTRGFGSRLIERGLAHDLGGKVELDFRREGVTCLVEAPLDEVGEEDVPA